jgi:hypothetical protein
MANYLITTDAVTTTITAASADEAARLFASGEGRAFAGVADVDSLLAAVDKIGDGAWVSIQEDGVRVADSRLADR